MGRVYYIPFSAVAITAATDLFEYLAATGKPFYLNSITIGQYTDFADAAAEQIPILIKKATSGYTSGSGGTTVTPKPSATSEQASGTVNAEVNNTTQAVAGGGALTTIFADVWNIALGFFYCPPREDRLLFSPTEAVVVSNAAPADSLTTNGVMVIEEL